MTAALALLLLAAPLGPPQVEHSRSREARGRLAAGDPAAALEAYRTLEREMGARPEIEAGRGAALLGLGRSAEAREAFGRAREAPEPLGSRALLGLGNALAAAGDGDGAAAAYREALARDPSFDDARHNLEVVLRRKGADAKRSEEEQPKPAPDGGGAARRRGPPPQATEGEKQAPDQRPSETGEPRPAERSGEGEKGGSPSRAEAERLLDAARARERALPAERRPGKPPAGRDW